MFGLFKKPKTEIEKYYENRNKSYDNYKKEITQDYDTSYVGDFSLIVEDVFTITGRGTVVVGKVNGTLQVGDNVTILDNGRIIKETRITGIEMFRKQVQVARTGDNVGILLRGVNRNEIHKGYVLSK